jgi:cellulose synthase/poly-beta-1,6-N-acetylglucosamine synthase-like glycosyltransferase
MSTKVPVQAADDVTLVVPVRDEEHNVDRLAAQIAAQRTPPAAVVFVDGGSTDSTVARLGGWCDRHPSWRVIETVDGTPGRGRNVGAETATTAWIAFTDAGIDIDPSWLARLMRVAVSHPSADVVWGNYEAAPPKGVFARVAQLAIVPPPSSTDRGPRRGRTVASSVVRRSAWERAGGFPDLRAAEDGIFVRRLLATDAHEAQAPEAIAHWHPPSTARQTFRRFRTYSRVNALAGEQARWHYGVARMYLVASPFAVMALRRRRWALVPLAGMALRSALTVARRREGRGIGWALNPARVAGVGGVLALIDTATFVGWIEAARDGRSR